jgi:hypothetical protein
MNDQTNIELIKKSEAVTSALAPTEDSSIKRIVAEALRRRGMKEIYIDADGGKKIPYVEWLATMVWDGIIEGEITFADGKAMDIHGETKLWMELVKFVSMHLDGGVNQNAQFNGVNIFKVYKGIDPDKV